VPNVVKQAENFSHQDDDERQVARALNDKDPTDDYSIKYIEHLKLPYSSRGSWEGYG
jgi:hypothetical protein